MAAAKKFRVNASSRDGFVDRRRAGHAWPRGAGNFREVVVVGTEEDPPGNEVDGQFAVGQKTYRALVADPEIYLNDSASATDPAAPDEEKIALKKRVAELEALLGWATEPAATGGKRGGSTDGDKGK